MNQRRPRTSLAQTKSAKATALALLIGMLLAACGGTSSSTEAAPQATSQETDAQETTPPVTALEQPEAPEATSTPQPPAPTETPVATWSNGIVLAKCNLGTFELSLIDPDSGQVVDRRSVTTSQSLKMAHCEQFGGTSHAPEAMRATVSADYKRVAVRLGTSVGVHDLVTGESVEIAEGRFPSFAVGTNTFAYLTYEGKLATADLATSWQTTTTNVSGDYDGNYTKSLIVGDNQAFKDNTGFDERRAVNRSGFVDKDVVGILADEFATSYQSNSRCIPYSFSADNQVLCATAEGDILRRQLSPDCTTATDTVVVAGDGRQDRFDPVLSPDGHIAVLDTATDEAILQIHDAQTGALETSISLGVDGETRLRGQTTLVPETRILGWGRVEYGLDCG